MRANYLKAMAVGLLLVVTINNFLSDSFLYVINGGWQHGTYFQASNYLQSALRWCQAVGYIVLPVAAFSKGSLYKNLATTFCLPVAVAYACVYSQTMSYYLADIPAHLPHGYVVGAWVRHLLLALELALSISIPLIIVLAQKHRPKLKQLPFCLAALPVLLLLQMPPYLPQSVVGLSLVNLPDVQAQWISATILLTLIVLLVFRFTSKQTRLEVCWLLSLALFLNYNYTFLRGLTIRSVPLQLCNIASYFMIIAMISKKPSFFYFVFLANVTGTLIAMLIPEAAEPKITSFHTVRFMWQHSLVFITPLCVLGLRIFPRLSGKSMLYSAVGFSAYWAFCLVFGAYINAHPEVFELDVNLFYLFDTEIISALAPWSVGLQTPVVVGGLTFRPFVQVLILVVFYGLTCLLYLVVQYLYTLSDDHLKLRNKLLEMLEGKFKREIKLPREYVE